MGRDERRNGHAANGAGTGLVLCGRGSGGNLGRDQAGDEGGWQRFRTRTFGNEDLRANTCHHRLGGLMTQVADGAVFR
jgi:hypothetical protein